MSVPETNSSSKKRLDIIHGPEMLGRKNQTDDLPQSLPPAFRHFDSIFAVWDPCSTSRTQWKHFASKSLRFGSLRE